MKYKTQEKGPTLLGITSFMNCRKVNLHISFCTDPVHWVHVLFLYYFLFARARILEQKIANDSNL